MKPAPFAYVASRSVDEAVEALAQFESATVLAGGQSLVPLMNLRLAQPAVLVDINDASGLDTIELSNGAIRFGSMCRQRRLEVDPTVREHAPLIAEAAAQIGHVQIRNRGTLGGSLAHADPVAELPTVLLALDGHVEVTSAEGSRTIAARDLYVGPLITTIEPGELLTAIEVPARQSGDGTAYTEFARRHGDFAITGIAAIIHRNESGSCTRARVAGAGLASTPVDLSAAAAAIVGSDELGDDALRSVAVGLAESLHPPTDIHASADYRTELAQILVVRALRSAWARAARREST